MNEFINEYKLFAQQSYVFAATRADGKLNYGATEPA